MSNILIKNLISHMQKRFLLSYATLSSAPPLRSSGTSSSAFTVQYLVNSCGIPLESALSVSKNFQIDEKNQQNAQSVVELFKSHNFSDSQVAELIVKRPKFLQSKVEDNLQPKLEYFVNKGFVGERLHMLIMSNYKILLRSLDSQIKPSFEYLSWLISSVPVHRFSWLLTSNLKDNIQPNLDYLKKEGVSASSLGKFITLHPRPITQNLDRMAYAVNLLKNLGFEPSSTIFVHTLRSILSMSKSTWEKKIEFMKSMGCEEQEIKLALKKNPFLLSCSEKKIKNVMDFCLNTTKLEPKDVIATPTIFNFAVEKTLRPRYDVVKVLEQKELIKVNKNILSILRRNEKEFLKSYIYKYIDKVPGLLDMYLDSKKAKMNGA
ncbi:uncharacterized protein [Euphorbia lathyris]|uniref:uncharacterized protein isoform X1 n=1 Tax=Euphorbia lathyris TaxID=212925 RepID=UPI0033144AC5